MQYTRRFMQHLKWKYSLKFWRKRVCVLVEAQKIQTSFFSNQTSLLCPGMFLCSQAQYTYVYTFHLLGIFMAAFHLKHAARWTLQIICKCWNITIMGNCIIHMLIHHTLQRNTLPECRDTCGEILIMFNIQKMKIIVHLA